MSSPMEPAVQDAVTRIHDAVASKGIDVNGVMTIAADVITMGTALSASSGVALGGVVADLLASQLTTSGLNAQSVSVLTSFVALLVPVVEKEVVTCWSWFVSLFSSKPKAITTHSASS